MSSEVRRVVSAPRDRPPGSATPRPATRDGSATQPQGIANGTDRSWHVAPDSAMAARGGVSRDSSASHERRRLMAPAVDAATPSSPRRAGASGRSPVVKASEAPPSKLALLQRPMERFAAHTAGIDTIPPRRDVADNAAVSRGLSPGAAHWYDLYKASQQTAKEWRRRANEMEAEALELLRAKQSLEQELAQLRGGAAGARATTVRPRSSSKDASNGGDGHNHGDSSVLRLEASMVAQDRKLDRLTQLVVDGKRAVLADSSSVFAPLPFNDGASAHDGRAAASSQGSPTMPAEGCGRCATFATRLAAVAARKDQRESDTVRFLRRQVAEDQRRVAELFASLAEVVAGPAPPLPDGADPNAMAAYFDVVQAVKESFIGARLQLAGAVQSYESVRDVLTEVHGAVASAAECLQRSEDGLGWRSSRRDFLEPSASPERSRDGSQRGMERGSSTVAQAYAVLSGCVRGLQAVISSLGEGPTSAAGDAAVVLDEIERDIRSFKQSSSETVHRLTARVSRELDAHRADCEDYARRLNGTEAEIDRLLLVLHGRGEGPPPPAPPHSGAQPSPTAASATPLQVHGSQGLVRRSSRTGALLLAAGEECFDSPFLRGDAVSNGGQRPLRSLPGTPRGASLDNRSRTPLTAFTPSQYFARRSSGGDLRVSGTVSDVDMHE